VADSNTGAPRLTIDKIIQKMQKLKGERGTWENHWQEVTDYVIPRKNTVLNKKSPGEKRTWQLLDNTGLHANEMLAGFLHGLLTNPDLPWFELSTGDLKLDTEHVVKQWLQDTTRAMHNVLNNSNFQTEIHELYLDLGSIGTACTLMEKDEKDIVRFCTKFIAEYFLEESSKGFADQLYREWQWNAVQLVNEFGPKALPKKVMDAYEKNKDEKFTCIHAVYPAVMVDPEVKKPYYISQYGIKEEKFEISHGRFSTFPYLVPRWSKAAGEKYGRSPGMNALPELKVLNKMNETMLIGAQKQVDPPVQMPDDGFIMPLITRPGGVNYYRAGSQDFVRPIFTDTRLDFGYAAMEDRRKRVRDAFFVDQLKLQQGGPMMTATEVLQRTEESMRLLGPMLGRMQSEFLSPMIERLFDIMWEQKLVPEIPEMLMGRKLMVRYSSLIAKSQRIQEAQSTMRMLEAATPFINMDQSLMQIFDGEKAIRVLMNTYGAPYEILRSQADFAKIKQGMQAAQAEQASRSAQMEDLSMATQMTESASKTQKNLG
jgi:hypothetical protein